MPRCSSPCASIPAPSPTDRSRSTLELSRIPALMRAATYSCVRASTTIDSMPSCASRWASSRPAGPDDGNVSPHGSFIEDNGPATRRRTPGRWPRSPPRRGPLSLPHPVIPNGEVVPLVEVRDEPGLDGRQPNRSWVRALDAGTSNARTARTAPKCPGASSAVIDFTGTSRCRPIVSAISRNGTPWSPTAFSSVPAGACSRASRNSRAASSRCTAGHTLAPSPM